MAAIEYYRYKTVTRKWNGDGFLEDSGFEPPAVEYSTYAMRHCLLDYNDPAIDRHMITCDVTLESLIELSRRRSEEIAGHAEVTLQFLLDECLEWSCDRLKAKIKTQFNLEGDVSAMSEVREGFRVQFTESISGRACRYFAEYRDRQWKLALSSD